MVLLESCSHENYSIAENATESTVTFARCSREPTHKVGPLTWRTRCYFGSTMVFEEPSGAGCMPGGDCPCGLSAGAPPLPVVIGPVRPCGCSCPLLSSGNTVRPVLCSRNANPYNLFRLAWPVPRPLGIPVRPGARTLHPVRRDNHFLPRFPTREFGFDFRWVLPMFGRAP